MTWTFAQILERASYGVTLFPGDVVGCGTCGTGCLLELNGSKITKDLWLQAGRRRGARDRRAGHAREPVVLDEEERAERSGRSARRSGKASGRVGTSSSAARTGVHRPMHGVPERSGGPPNRSGESVRSVPLRRRTAPDASPTAGDDERTAPARDASPDAHPPERSGPRKHPSGAPCSPRCAPSRAIRTPGAPLLTPPEPSKRTTRTARFTLPPPHSWGGGPGGWGSRSRAAKRFRLSPPHRSDTKVPHADAPLLHRRPAPPAPPSSVSARSPRTSGGHGPPSAHELFVRIDARPLGSASTATPSSSSRASTSGGSTSSRATTRSRVASTSRSRRSSATCSARAGSRRHFPECAGARIAYFSMEYGIHECLPIYSGGLGVLAGDHLKTASDSGLPLVGVGLAYAEGYFRQVLNGDGWQHERYPINDWHRMPVLPRRSTRDGQTLRHRRHVPARDRQSAALEVPGGARAALLLDTNIEAELARGPRDHRTALRRRPGVPRPPGDHARHRRRPRARGASGSRRRSVT